ncbi:hypothetical protein A8926_0778 [Saccharopolyspora spinosa]|uniref:Uncharacterized protein n=1 Tax=Saccharopolyspora spinosa TaxID=60894 RepID=A0A2N3XRJ1_SACSN|nr:hypothetical protein A8926_0778 [Saccharopolyspora spinosa]
MGSADVELHIDRRILRILVRFVVELLVEQFFEIAETVHSGVMAGEGHLCRPSRSGRPSRARPRRTRRGGGQWRAKVERPAVVTKIAAVAVKASVAVVRPKTVLRNPRATLGTLAERYATT